MAATLDGIVEQTGAVFEAKFMLASAFTEEAAAEKHMAELQHNMWITAARSSVLSIITGGGQLRRVDLVGIAPDFKCEAEFYKMQNALSWRVDRPAPRSRPGLPRAASISTRSAWRPPASARNLSPL